MLSLIQIAILLIVTNADRCEHCPAPDLTVMEVLKSLFEQHFHNPVARAEPLQGQLGGSGRKIIRLSSDHASAIGILYGDRKSVV